MKKIKLILEKMPEDEFWEKLGKSNELYDEYTIDKCCIKLLFENIDAFEEWFVKDKHLLDENARKEVKSYCNDTREFWLAQYQNSLLNKAK